MKDGFLLGILVFYPFIGGLLAYLAGRKNEKSRNVTAYVIALSELAIMLYLMACYGPFAVRTESGHAFLEFTVPRICGLGLHFTLDGFRVIYGTIVALMWAGATLLSGEYFRHHKNTNRFYLFLLWTLGATMAVFLSADLFTTFIFFEIMSFTSYTWVAQEENKESLNAAATYLAVAVIGGLVMLMGLMILYHELGTVAIGELLEATELYEGNRIWIYAAGVCLFFGFAAKAGAFPLHIWLPKAHPVAPAPASALLSGILTKTGMFGILVVSCHLFLYDIKAFNNNVHKEFVGVSNELILNNLRKLLERKANVSIKIPVIPTVNDSIEEMKSIKCFLAPYKPHVVELLPYHKMGEHKYNALGINMSSFNIPSKEKMEELNAIFQHE